MKNRSVCAMFCAAMTASCGQGSDDIDNEACVGAKCDAVGESTGGATASSPFDGPEDFTDRSGCTPGALTGLDLTGVWHHYTGEAWPAEEWFAIDFRRDKGGSYKLTYDDFASYVWGSEDLKLEITDDYMFIKADLEDGDYFEQSIFYCAHEDGKISGQRVMCTNGECADIKPFHAVRIERPEPELAKGVELLGEFTGESETIINDDDLIAYNVRVRDGIAYVAAHGRNILVDVSDPTHPKELKVLPGAFEGERYNDVKLYEAGDGKPYALFASAKRGIVTVDISDPLNAHEVAVFPVDPPYPTDSNGGAAEPGVKFRHGAGLDMSKTEVHTLFTETRNGRTLAYLAMRSHQTLDIWDITDARNPRKLGDYLYPGSELTDGISFDHIHDLYVEDGIAYLNAWGQGLLMLDCNDPSAPVLLGQYDSYAPRIQRSSHSNWVTTTSSGRRVSLTDDEDFTSYVHVVDVDPASPQFMQKIGGYQKMEGVAPHNIMAVGDRAYIAHYNFGLRVLDIADPTQPKEIAHYNTWDPDHNEYVSVFDGALGLDLDLENKLIYVIDWGRGLLIFKLTV